MAIHSFRVLLIDDEVSHRAQLERSLQHQGCAVTIAGRRDTAVALLTSGAFDLAIVEPNLPEASWLRLLRSVRAAAPQVALLVVTAFSSRSLAAEAADLGIIAVLSKPVSTHRVLAVLRGEQPGLAPVAPPDLSLAHAEWEHINDVLRACEGNVARTARCLGITRQSLYNKLRKAPRVMLDHARSGDGALTRVRGV